MAVMRDPSETQGRTSQLCGGRGARGEEADTTRNISKHLFWRRQGQRSGTEMSGAVSGVSASRQGTDFRTPESPSPPPAPFQCGGAAPDFLYSRCSWRLCHHPQHRPCWSSRSCPTSQSGSTWHSPQPAAFPAAGCQESPRWLMGQEEKEGVTGTKGLPGIKEVVDACWFSAQPFFLVTLTSHPSMVARGAAEFVYPVSWQLIG